MTMIQFAINSSQNGLMTLKEIYTWLQQHFDFFRDENRRGWKVPTPSLRPSRYSHDVRCCSFVLFF